MSYIFSAPLPSVSTQFKIIKVDIQKIAKLMNIVYQLVDADGVASGSGQALIRDIGDATDFTDFYNTWMTEEQLYAKVAELKGFTGTYAQDNGFV